MLPQAALHAVGPSLALWMARCGPAAAAAAVAALPAAVRQQTRAAASSSGGAPHGQERPPIIPDREGPMPGGRSSETVAVQRVTDPGLLQLVDDIFALYEARDPDQQRRIIRRRYAPDATYQNNIMRVQGTEAILRRFALLPRTTEAVTVTYDPPLELGATASSPDGLGNLGFKGDLEVEVKNSQKYDFAHPSILRILVMPRTDVELPVLTRLALDRSSLLVRHHQDVWLNQASIWGPLRRGWGALATAASAAVRAPPPPGDDPGHQPRRPRRAEEGEQSEPEEQEATEKVGERGGGGGSGRAGGRGEGEDSGLRRAPPGVEPVPA